MVDITKNAKVRIKYFPKYQTTNGFVYRTEEEAIREQNLLDGITRKCDAAGCHGGGLWDDTDCKKCGGNGFLINENNGEYDGTKKEEIGTTTSSTCFTA